MACWLLLQAGVESVRFKLITADGQQNMTWDVIPEALAELMQHEAYVLRGRDPRTFVSVASLAAVKDMTNEYGVYEDEEKCL